jgi:GR25 family glycosyltransferase involved in LPS biosynthesis
MMNFKYFIISLAEKQTIIDKFTSLSSKFVHIPAIDTRLFDCKDDIIETNFNLDLNPANINSAYYFNKCKGALGCYLSHYTFWKSIIENNLDFGLVFEDDAKLSDVSNLISKNLETEFLNDDNPLLIQFNKRTTEQKLPFWFDGTESYAVNKKGAQLLIDKTHDFSEFADIFIEYAYDQKEFNKSKSVIYDKYNYYVDSHDFKTLNTIRYAVDKFIGYCSHSDLNATSRLNIKLRPEVSLHMEGQMNSEVKGGGSEWFEVGYREFDAFVESLNLWWLN